MDHQDWKPVVFKKNIKPVHVDRKAKTVQKIEDDKERKRLAEEERLRKEEEELEA